jgi:hypothetical protein
MCFEGYAIVVIPKYYNMTQGAVSRGTMVRGNTSTLDAEAVTTCPTG